jgi:predicted nucleic acid-binding protein
MKYVLDASVAVKWVLPEPDSPQALSLRDDSRRQIHELIAPDTFPIEVAHALTRAERKGLLQAGEATVKLTDVLASGPDLRTYLPLLPRAVELSSQVRVGVYDCLYVALAEQEGCELASADRRLSNAFPGRVVMLGDLP